MFSPPQFVKIQSKLHCTRRHHHPSVPATFHFRNCVCNRSSYTTVVATDVDIELVAWQVVLGDQTSWSPQYQIYLQMLKQGQTEAPARWHERTEAPEQTADPARKVWQRPANTK